MSPVLMQPSIKGHNSLGVGGFKGLREGKQDFVLRAIFACKGLRG